jgi:hypothetical protein
MSLSRGTVDLLNCVPLSKVSPVGTSASVWVLGDRQVLKVNPDVCLLILCYSRLHPGFRPVTVNNSCMMENGNKSTELCGTLPRPTSYPIPGRPKA